MSRDLIYTCGCGDTDKFAKDAFKLLFPDAPLPSIIHPGQQLEGTELVFQVAHAYDKSINPFAIYMGDKGFWDLLKGKRIR